MTWPAGGEESGRLKGRALQIDRSGQFFVSFLQNIAILGGEITQNLSALEPISVCTASAAQTPKRPLHPDGLRAAAAHGQAANG